LTFAHAINAARASCGDTLFLMNNAYGDGTSTGKISISGLVCSAGNELTIAALNQRKAKISDNGSGRAIFVTNSAYLIFDGLYVTSADNSGSSSGSPMVVTFSHHITIKNMVGKNPNRYRNLHIWAVQDSQDVLMEDNEGYVYHRHCVLAWESERVVIRRQYCTPRGGRISGGYNAGAGLGGSDTVTSMYPCKDCILENPIADGRTGPMPLMEINGTFGSGTLASGSKVLGAICYNCRYGNAIYLNSRNVVSLNNTPQNILIRDLAVIDFDSPSSVIRASDGVNITVENVTVTGDGGVTGLTFDDSPTGATPAQQSFVIRNSTVSGLVGRGFNKTTTTTDWSGSYLNSHNNGTAFFPSLPANWTNTSTSNPGFGLCKGVWVPDASPLKGAGPGGADIGANILYRYVNGVLTTIPLWDPTTGEFPHGEADLDGINRVAGQSLFDIHVPLKINDGDCPFPSGYAGGGGGEPTEPENVVGSTNLTGPHVHVIPEDSAIGLRVGVAVIYTGAGTPAHATSLSSSCGGTEDIPALLEDPVLTGTSTGHRSLMVFALVDPTPGTCTLTPTFSTANVTGWAMVSVQDANVGSYGAVATGTALSSSASVTTEANADEMIGDFFVTSSSPTVSVGPGQTPLIDQLHGSVSLRVASSIKSGANGQQVEYSMTAGYYYAFAAVPIIPPSPGGPSGATRTLTKYRGECGLGPEDFGCLLRSTAATNAPFEVAPRGLVRIRAEVSGGVDTSTAWGVHWYCQENAGGYYRVLDSFGENNIRWIGSMFSPFHPSSQTTTTQQLSEGNYVAGALLTNQTSNYSAPSMTSTQKTELVGIFELGPSITGTFNCRPQIDNGNELDTYTVTPTGNVVTPRVLQGF